MSTSATGGSELLTALLSDDPPFNPFTGVARGDAVRAFRAAELGLEAPRFCPLCGRRMVTQVYPHGYAARCSRHGDVTSAQLHAAADATRDPFAEP